MNKERIDTTEANIIVSAMMRDDAVLGLIEPSWTPSGSFVAPIQNRFAGISVGHYRSHGVSPNGSFQRLLERDVADRSEAEAEAAWKYYEELESIKLEPTDVLLKLAIRVLRDASIQRIELELRDAVSCRDYAAAALVLQKTPLSVMPAMLDDVSVDFDLWAGLEQGIEKSIVNYPPPLDKFFSGMVKGTLFSFMAPDKSGKSFLLMDLAYRAVRQGSRVCYFEAGDLGRRETLFRLGVRASGKPRGGGAVSVPVGWAEDGSVQREEKEFGDGPLPHEFFHAMKRASRGERRFLLSCHSCGTLSAANMTAILASQERAGWKADVVVVDYADILAPPLGVREMNDQIDETWRQLRRLSQERDCLVVTATQSNADAYKEKSKLLGMKNFSGRKTKLAHVNGMVGINSTKAEKSQGIMRLNWIVRRDAQNGKPVRVAGNLTLARPIMLVEQRGKDEPEEQE
jgi:hypothetical protein